LHVAAQCRTFASNFSVRNPPICGRREWPRSYRARHHEYSSGCLAGNDVGLDAKPCRFGVACQTCTSEQRWRTRLTSHRATRPAFRRFAAQIGCARLWRCRQKQNGPV